MLFRQEVQKFFWISFHDLEKILQNFANLAKYNCQDLGKKFQKSKKFLGKKTKTPSTGNLVNFFEFQSFSTKNPFQQSDISGRKQIKSKVNSKLKSSFSFCAVLWLESCILQNLSTLSFNDFIIAHVSFLGAFPVSWRFNLN